MEQHNVWGTNLVDFNKLVERSDVVGAWVFVNYLTLVVNDRLSSNGSYFGGQLYDCGVDAFGLKQSGGVVDQFVKKIDNEFRPVLGSVVGSTIENVCLLSSTLGFNSLVEFVGTDVDWVGRAVVENFWVGAKDAKSGKLIAQSLVTNWGAEVNLLSVDALSRLVLIEGYRRPVSADTLVELRETLSSSVQSIGGMCIKLVRGWII